MLFLLLLDSEVKSGQESRECSKGPQVRIKPWPTYRSLLTLGAKLESLKESPSDYIYIEQYVYTVNSL